MKTFDFGGTSTSTKKNIKRSSPITPSQNATSPKASHGTSIGEKQVDKGSTTPSRTSVRDNPPTVCSHDVSKHPKQEPSSEVKMADDIRSARSVRVHQPSTVPRRSNAVMTTSTSPTSRLIATSNNATTNEKDGIADGGESSVDCNESQAVNVPERRTAGIFGFYTTDARTSCTSTTKGTTRLRGENSLNPDAERTYDVSCDSEKKNHQVEMASDVRRIAIASVDQTMFLDSKDYTDSSATKSRSSQLIVTSNEATTNEKDEVADEEKDAIDYVRTSQLNHRTCKQLASLSSTSTSTSKICTGSTTTTELGEVLHLQKEQVDVVPHDSTTVISYTVVPAQIGVRRATRIQYGVEFPWDRGKY